jgi:hypothetical protein
MRLVTIAAVLATAFAAPASAGDLAQAPASRTTTVPAPELSQAKKGYGKREGLIPGLLIGPKLSIVNLPSPAIGLELKTLDNLIGASFDFGIIPDVSISGASAGFSDWNVGAKVYPYRGRFFVGALYGSRSFHASAMDSVTLLTAKLDISSAYIAPEIGWRFVWESGLFMGLDLGWQFVLSHSTTLTVPTGVPASQQASFDDAKKAVTDAGDIIGDVGLPVLGLVQIGFFL